MRQWLVPVKKLCNQHLLGEHVEHHMFVGCINKGKNILGYIEKGLVDTSTLKARHNELANEMEARGFKHESPLPLFYYADIGYVDKDKNMIELNKRCSKCKERGK